MKLSSSIKITCAAVIVSLTAITATHPNAAQQSQFQASIQFSPPTPPDRGDPSDRGQGGGHRGLCDKAFPGLVALVPTPYPDLPENHWGLTVSDRPTVWFDIPSGIQENTLVEWRLRDSKSQTVYKTVLRLPKTQPGVVGFSITKPIPIGSYQWDLALYCDSSGIRSTDDVDFDLPLIRRGRLQRVAVPQPLQQALSVSKTSLDRAKSYAQYGIWYDALTSLGTQLQSSQSKERTVSNAWSELLRQQKLESKSSSIVTPCCTR
ncbi:DUF928 domain-containing protein [Pseudanabaenaceae cyanobacterium LEGE 13415]|nr:DUF928 domain-containing protein [Pseudanabaenaceae cyanobacterium LEGE 13415]